MPSFFVSARKRWTTARTSVRALSIEALVFCTVSRTCALSGVPVTEPLPDTVMVRGGIGMLPGCASAVVVPARTVMQRRVAMLRGMAISLEKTGKSH